jgi:hypothetical protein
MVSTELVDYKWITSYKNCMSPSALQISVVFAQQGRKRPDDYRAMGAPPRDDHRGMCIILTSHVRAGADKWNMQWLCCSQPCAVKQSYAMVVMLQGSW